MLLSAIMANICPTETIKDNKAIKHSGCSVNHKRSNVLQDQLHFTGLCNQALIHSEHPALKAYLTKLDHHREIPGFTILSKYEKSTDTRIHPPVILFDTPKKFDKALDLLGTLIDRLQKSMEDNEISLQFSMEQSCLPFNLFKKAVEEGKIPNFNIKGFMGRGDYNAAFLTADNNIIKLSSNPNFPDKIIEGVEVPIYARYIADNVGREDEKVYGVLEELTETAPLRGIGREELEAIFQTMNGKLAKINPDYYIHDDHDMQIGFIGNTPYLIDHGCITNRLLAETLQN